VPYVNQFAQLSSFTGNLWRLTSRFVSKAQAALTTSSRAVDKSRMSLIYVSLAIVHCDYHYLLPRQQAKSPVLNKTGIASGKNILGSCSSEIFVFVAMSMIFCSNKLFLHK
jgi:hypothetical protein